MAHLTTQDGPPVIMPVWGIINIITKEQRHLTVYFLSWFKCISLNISIVFLRKKPWNQGVDEAGSSEINLIRREQSHLAGKIPPHNLNQVYPRKYLCKLENIISQENGGKIHVLSSLTLFPFESEEMNYLSVLLTPKPGGPRWLSVNHLWFCFLTWLPLSCFPLLTFLRLVFFGPTAFSLA